MPYEPCEKRPGRVGSLSLVRYRNNDYSVPTAYGHRAVMIGGYVDRVEIVCGSEQIACHRRSYAREDFAFDPLRARLLERSRALDQAAPLAVQRRDGFGVLRRLLKPAWASLASGSSCRFCACWKVFPLEVVTAAVGAALARGAIGLMPSSIWCCAGSRRRPPRLDLTLYPYLPKAEVRTTSPGAYLSLLAGTGSMSATPQLLLGHHLKALRLPTFVRRGVRQGGSAMHRRGPRSRPLSAPPGRAGDDRPGTAPGRAAHSGGPFPSVKSLDSCNFTALPSLNKALVLELARCECTGAPRRRDRPQQCRHRRNPPRAGLGPCRLPKGPCSRLHHRRCPGPRAD